MMLKNSEIVEERIMVFDKLMDVGFRTAQWMETGIVRYERERNEKKLRIIKKLIITLRTTMSIRISFSKNMTIKKKEALIDELEMKMKVDVITCLLEKDAGWAN
jgi:hypothetical protein